MIVRVLLLLHTSRNTENWQEIFNFLLHRLLWGVSFRALFVSFFLWRDLCNNILIFCRVFNTRWKRYYAKLSGACKGISYKISRSCLHFELLALAHDVFDQEFTGSPNCKEWALSSVFFLPFFFPHKAENTISRFLKTKRIKSIVCGFSVK